MQTAARAYLPLLPTFLSRFLSSSTRRRTAELPSWSQAPLKQQENAQSSHIHSDEASKSSTQGTDLRPGLGLTGHGEESPDRQVSGIESCKQVLPVSATSPEYLVAVLKVLEEFLSSSEGASQALAASPGILNQGSEDLEQKLMILAYCATREKVLRRVCATPHVLSQELELLHNILHVFEEIGLSAKARNRLLWVQSAIARSTGRTLLHAADFFTCLGMPETEVSRLVERRPFLFVRSVHALEGFYTFFRQLGLSVHEFIRVAQAGFPPLATRTLGARVKFLKDEGFSDSEVHLLILRQPAILAVRCDYLKEKLNFLRCKQKYDCADIARCPGCLLFSLKNRLIPRLTAVEERGLYKVYSLSRILLSKDADFHNMLRIRGKN